MANRAFMNFGRSYENLTMPVKVSLSFTVDSTQNSGISGLKSNGYVKAVQMHTSGTSALGANPANGIIRVQLTDNFASMINMISRIQAPVTGSAISVKDASSLTVGTPYQITSLGTTTAAEWLAIGLPAGVTAAVGMSFIALATSAGGSHTGQVKAIGNSGIQTIETVGNPQLQLGPQGVSNQGAYLLFQCLGATDSSTTTLIPKAPAAGSVIQLTLLLDNSSVNVDGL